MSQAPFFLIFYEVHHSLSAELKWYLM